MLQIQENVSLKPYNTFGIKAYTKFFSCPKSLEDLQELVELPEFRNNIHFVLGGGSNVLFCEDFPGIIIHPEIYGVEIVQENVDFIDLRVGAGENWHQLVIQTVDQNLYGLENLSLIPGTVGAAPIQNIGAYGVEFESVFQELLAFNKATKQAEVFHHADCRFGYRNSIFKNEAYNQYIVVNVTVRLFKKGTPVLGYGPLAEAFSSSVNPSPREVSDEVIRIRQSKLPDPAETGNAGSFFKNPVVTLRQYLDIKNGFPNAPSYPVDQDLVKVPAGWLIEQTGWKGKSIGNAGVYPKQALVLVNHGESSGKEILNLSRSIQADVKKIFGINLEPEVNIIPNPPI